MEERSVLIVSIASVYITPALLDVEIETIFYTCRHR